MRRASILRILLGAILLTGCSAAAAKAPVSASTGPRVVLIIRHAEKPDGKDPNLSPRGYERARALPAVFAAGKLPRPDFIIATKKSSHSDRPLETITPLAESMHLQVEHGFKDGDFDALAESLQTEPRYAGKTVLIAWHHGTIPGLAHALGANEAPDKWKESVFDRVWKITYEHGKTKWEDLPEHALPGDSD